MRINNNISAMNTYSRLTSAQGAQAKSLEKLSSGLRINRAGDDAAGLAISEKMRGQIKGLNQAVRNSQDGISLIQTAEGALSESHSILNRMRELAVQSANDTNTVDDRGEIQKELDQLKSELDRIGNTTEFNTKKLINGSQTQSATLDVANAAGFASVKASNPMDLGDYTITVANSSTQAVNFDAGLTGLTSDKVTWSGNNLGKTYTLKIEEGTNNDKKFTLTDSNGVSQELDDRALGTITFGDISIDTTSASSNGEIGFTLGVVADYSVSKGGTNVGSITGNESANGRISVGGFEVNVDENIADGSSTVTVAGEALRFQVGANENQSIRLSMGDMRSSALGVSDIKVDSHDNSKAAITTIDSAITKVSEERSKLGALQNRLDHTINNLTTTSENLSAAESRIRDVDMAKEMMEFTKNNILNQASTAMLAQANQMPQGVLQLLG